MLYASALLSLDVIPNRMFYDYSSIYNLLPRCLFAVFILFSSEIAELKDQVSLGGAKVDNS